MDCLERVRRTTAHTPGRVQSPLDNSGTGWNGRCLATVTFLHGMHLKHTKQEHSDSADTVKEVALSPCGD